MQVFVVVVVVVFVVSSGLQSSSCVPQANQQADLPDSGQSV